MRSSQAGWPLRLARLTPTVVTKDASKPAKIIDSNSFNMITLPCYVSSIIEDPYSDGFQAMKCAM